MGLFGSKELIGLDIGSSSVKMAHVKAVGAENRLRKFGVFPFRPTRSSTGRSWTTAPSSRGSRPPCGS